MWVFFLGGDIMNAILSEIYSKLHKIEKLLREQNVEYNLKQYYVGQMSGLRMAIDIIKKEKHYES